MNQRIIQERNKVRRSTFQKAKDFFTFPFRALTLFIDDKWGMSSLRSERFDYVAREVIGRCLDVGCGKDNFFITRYLNGEGKGIDVYPYEGLTEEHLVQDLTHFPFDDASFESVTFIANINHVPKSQRDAELAEAYRCLKPSGNIILTMGNPVAEILVHKVTHFYDTFLGTNLDMDSERGMHHEEDFYLLDSEIIRRLKKAGFTKIRKKRFLTQWGLNHLIVGWKE